MISPITFTTFSANTPKPLTHKEKNLQWQYCTNEMQNIDNMLTNLKAEDSLYQKKKERLEVEYKKYLDYRNQLLNNPY